MFTHSHIISLTHALTHSLTRFVSGVIGKSSLSDIAIDDVIFTPGCYVKVPKKVYPNIRGCQSDEFQCAGRGNCLSDADDVTCNGVNDCKDGSDEAESLCNPSHNKHSAAGAIVGKNVS